MKKGEQISYENLLDSSEQRSNCSVKIKEWNGIYMRYRGCPWHKIKQKGHIEQLTVLQWNSLPAIIL